MTVLENLQMGASTAETSDFANDLDRVLALFPRLRQRVSQRGGTLSGGEQMLAIAFRALMARPRLLLLDEPSLGLALMVVRQIFDAIKALNTESGFTVFLVEQNAYHALKLAHRGYVMVNGFITLFRNGPRIAGPPEIKAAYFEGGGIERGVYRLLYSRASLRRALFCWFLLVSIVLGGGAALLAGRAIAATWRPYWQIVAYSFMLAAAVRFIHFSLFGGTPFVFALLFGR